MTITFIIEGEPVGKGRPRFNGKTGNTYTPDKTVNYEAWVKTCFAFRGAHEPLCGEITATIEAYFGIPKSIKGAARVRMEKGIVRPTKKPDTDNIAKGILDALNGLAYKDDSYVVELTVRKLYAEKPFVKVTLAGD